MSGEGGSRGKDGQEGEVGFLKWRSNVMYLFIFIFMCLFFSAIFKKNIG